MRLRLEFEVEYEHKDDPSLELDEHRQLLDKLLLNIATTAIDEGVIITGVLPVDITNYSAQVVRVS